MRALVFAVGNSINVPIDALTAKVLVYSVTDILKISNITPDIGINNF